MFTAHAMWGLSAGLLSFGAYLLYARSILSRRTKPSLVTWGIWSVLLTFTAASYLAVGAHETFWFSMGNALGAIVCGVLAFKTGRWIWTPLDFFALLGALLGIGIWAYANSPFAALAAFIAADFMGALPTLYKAAKNPSTEELFPWGITAAASVLGLLAVRFWSTEIALYPLYMALTNLSIFALLLRGTTFRQVISRQYSDA